MTLQNTTATSSIMTMITQWHRILSLRGPVWKFPRIWANPSFLNTVGSLWWRRIQLCNSWDFPLIILLFYIYLIIKKIKKRVRNSLFLILQIRICSTKAARRFIRHQNSLPIKSGAYSRRVCILLLWIKERDKGRSLWIKKENKYHWCFKDSFASG